MSPTVEVDPILEAIERKLADIEAVIALDNYHGTNEAQKLIARTAKAGRQAAIEYAIAKARANAGKFASDAAMDAFIEELKEMKATSPNKKLGLDWRTQ